MQKKIIKAFFIITLCITILSFIKILSNAKESQLETLAKRSYPLYQAQHDPIKIYPKENNNSHFTINQRVYDFIKSKSWHLDTNIEHKKKSSVEEKENLKSQKIYANKINSSGDQVNYKKHNIKIVDLPKKDDETPNKNNITVQLGAFNSYDSALKEKNRILLVFPHLLKKYNFYIEKGSLKNNNLIYRLKVKYFNSITHAKEFCTRIRKKDIGCFFVAN